MPKGLLKTRLCYGFQYKNQLNTQFADHALSEVGKLSFKERDVSFFRIFYI